MSDRIFDLAEISCEEFESCRILEEYLEAHGFQVEHGVGGMETAFRAIYEQGEGGPSFGLLAEYDALSMGHGCGHQMQGPAVIGAALCIRELCGEKPYKIVVYGTPAEEALGGKIIMQENGCFRDIDRCADDAWSAGDLRGCENHGAGKFPGDISWKGSPCAMSPEKEEAGAGTGF